MKVLYSDTDSYILKIKTRNLQEDLRNLKQTFDFSNLNKTHPLYDVSNKAKLFYFKEEFSLLPILRMVFLGSKVYCVETVCCHQYEYHKQNYCENNTDCRGDNKNFLFSEKIVLKGISKVSRKDITFQDYLSCLTNQISKKVFDYRIRSKKQEIKSTMVKNDYFGIFL